MSNKKHTVDVIHHIEKIQQRCKSQHVSKLRAPLDSKVPNKMIPLSSSSNISKQKSRNIPKNQSVLSNRGPSKYAQTITADLRAREDILDVRESVQQRRVKEAHSLNKNTYPRNHRSSTKKMTHRADQKVLIEVEKKSLNETEQNLGWAKIGKEILQNPEDVKVWESKIGFAHKELSRIWDLMGKEKIERETSYRSINHELYPMIRQMTSRAYEMAMGVGGHGKLPPEDRAKLDTSIAQATKRVYNEYLQREQAEMAQLQNEINKLKKTIARYRSEQRKLQNKEIDKQTKRIGDTSNNVNPVVNKHQKNNTNTTNSNNVDENDGSDLKTNNNPLSLDWNDNPNAKMPLLELLDVLLTELSSYESSKSN